MTAGGSHTATTLAQRQLRLMRSKLPTIIIGWYDAVPFDLIRSGLSRTTSPYTPGGFGRCKPAAPTAPHPAGIVIPATFPQGKAIFVPRRGIFQKTALPRMGILNSTPFVRQV